MQQSESTVRKTAREKNEVSAERGSAPWWMWIVAASFVFNFAIVVYLDFEGPILGFDAPFTRRGVVVARVYSALTETAGVRPGDHIMRADGRMIASYVDWNIVLLNLKVGEPTIFEIQRENETFNVTVRPEPRLFFRDRHSLLLRPLGRVGQFVMLGLAIFLAFARPKNGNALLAALFFAGFSGYNPPQILSGAHALVRDLPAIPFALIWISVVAGGLAPPLLFTFCARFPRPLIEARWFWAVVWMPYLLLLIPNEILAYRTISNSHYAAGSFSQWYSWILITSVTYLVASVGAVIMNYRRLTDINERRRIRIVVFGSGAGLLALAELILLLGPPTFRGTLVETIFLSTPAVVVSAVLLCFVFPLSFAYSILRHRLFDVRVIIRQGIQHALARGVLLSIIPLLVVALLADMFFHGDQSLASIVRSRGWIYGVIGTLAIIVYQKRQGWLNQIDRLFFRDQFDAQCLLQDVIQKVKSARDLVAASYEVVGQIQRALHSEFVCLLHRAADQVEFRTMACEPARSTTTQLHKDAKLISLLRVMEKPLQFSGATWVADKFRDEAIQFIEGQNIDLLVPIVMGTEAAESILVLGPKRSEEPYSREDEKLLTAIAASLGLLSTRSVAQRDRQSFQECPTCGACFDSADSRCKQDGSGLVRIHMPRLLIGRYRLDRRIGSGGMGTVYAGTDDALNRPIAIKVIRPELVQDPHVTARFQQEARSAAALIHRNVITIYDYGIESGYPYIIMELLAGRTLRTELDRTKLFSPSRTIEIMDGVCGAVEEAHRQELLHRDLKPENIFLAETSTGDVVKVLDFGLAKAVATSIQPNDPTRMATSMIVGTPYYMAPEQLTGETASQATDVWALGVIAYEMLFGAHPFITGSVASWQKVILTGSLTSGHAHLRNVSRDWHTLFDRVFQPDPKQRIGSARIFFNELLGVSKSTDQKTKANSLNSE
jgi:hypothetical protein